MNSRLSAALRDRYVLEAEIGHGGMATVYAARDVRHSRRVVVKCVDAGAMAEPNIESIPPDAFATPQLVARAHFSVTDTGYERKFNLDTAGPTAENEIRIVRVGEDWFALIRSASGSDARFAVVRRPDPHNLDPPGSARWGWLDNDENVWVRCGSACCEITEGRLEEL